MFPTELTRGPAGIVDVARRAGVSPSTVSRTLRGATNVSDDARERVLKAAAELDYVPSPAASRLASGRARTVGVVVPFTNRWFFVEVVRGAATELRAAGYDLLLYDIGEHECRSEFFDAMPLRRRVDAVLVVASAFSPKEAAALCGLRVPVVTVGTQLNGMPRVGIDDTASAEMAVRHLLLLGHRDICMISGAVDDPIGRATSLSRRAGFRSALAEAGIDGANDRIVAQPWGLEGGRQAMENLLGQSRLPTALFAESDEMAFGALQTLRRAGLGAPHDVSIIGFDDHEMAAATDLTTVAQPVTRQGALAAGLLLKMLEDGGSEHDDIMLPTRLLVRGSTAPAGRGP